MPKPTVSILYCPRCGWLLRSAWLAQELLTTFAEELGGVTLEPAEEGGTFVIEVDGHAIWERRADGGFPQPKELKQRLRDRIAPERNLGHSEAKLPSTRPPRR